jgi:hypothetical protein
MFKEETAELLKIQSIFGIKGTQIENSAFQYEGVVSGLPLRDQFIEIVKVKTIAN